MKNKWEMIYGVDETEVEYDFLTNDEVRRLKERYHKTAICANCRYWDGSYGAGIATWKFTGEEFKKDLYGIDCIGACTRFPPVIIGEKSEWPLVNFDRWCGEYSDDADPWLNHFDGTDK